MRAAPDGPRLALQRIIGLRWAVGFAPFCSMSMLASCIAKLVIIVLAEGDWLSWEVKSIKKKKVEDSRTKKDRKWEEVGEAEEKSMRAVAMKKKLILGKVFIGLEKWENGNINCGSFLFFFTSFRTEVLCIHLVEMPSKGNFPLWPTSQKFTHPQSSLTKTGNDLWHFNQN